MANGTVKWFNNQKGFGFIAPEHGTKDIFVHISALERAGLQQLDDGQTVTFDVESGRDGREVRDQPSSCIRQFRTKKRGGMGFGLLPPFLMNWPSALQRLPSRY